MEIAELSDDALTKALPRILKKMSEVTSVGTALKIAERYGGARVCFPLDPKDDDELTRLVGLPAATALGQKFGGVQTEVPRAKSAFALKQNQEICRQRAQGVPADCVALKFGVTRRHVNRVFSKETKS